VAVCRGPLVAVGALQTAWKLGGYPASRQRRRWTMVRQMRDSVGEYF